MSGAPHVLVLASGGDRMNTTLARALQPVFFKPMIRHVLDAALTLPKRSLGVVAGAAERELREELRGYAELQFFPAGLLEAAEHLGGGDADVLVAGAGFPLISPRSLGALWSAHAASGADVTVAWAEAEDPAGLPRVLGGESPAAVKDEVLCTPAERLSRAVPAGLLAFRLSALIELLRDLPPAEGRESRVTDAVAAAAARGLKRAAVRVEDPGEALDAADLHALSRAEAALRARRNKELMLQGVAMRDPATTTVDPRSRIGRDAVIEGGVLIVNSSVEAGAVIESGCRVLDSSVGPGTVLKQGTRLDRSRTGRGCVLGPYANVRPGTTLGDDVRLGNFVEVKNSSVGDRTKISHLSYVGDAEIGRDVNIGCGFVTCNSDGGPVKRRTVIEDGVFVGSDSQAVAPVRLGAGCFVATATTVTEDVPAGALAISRGRQTTKPGYALKYAARRTPRA